MRKLCTLIATGFGLGYSPVASGTVGCFLGIPLAWGISHLPLGAQIASALALSLLCIPICNVAEKELGGEKDNGRIVADEYLTFPICLLGVSTATLAIWWVIPMAFVVNRLMDIIKPFPAYRLQSLPGGLGITIDDFIASLYALGINWLVIVYGSPIINRIAGV